MRAVFVLGLLTGVIACNEVEVERSGIEVMRINKVRVDSIRLHSDTGYSRSIGAGEFFTAEQWLSKKDSTLTKIMRDTSGNITAIVQFKKNTRISYEEYYPNGQLKGRLPLNTTGQLNGPSVYYYPDGRIKAAGNYRNGFFRGTWKIYNEKGKMVSTEEYDENGQLKNSVPN